MKIAFLLMSLLISISANAERGGITAGGGDISVPDPIDQPSLQKMIVDSKFTLIQWANYAEYWWVGVNKPLGGGDPQAEFLFERSNPVFEWIRKTEIRVENNGPCRDGDGRETDGSVHGLPKGMICISAQRLGKKLSQINYEYEVAGLVMHEIAHLMGADEDMAMDIQKNVVTSLSNKRRFDIYMNGKKASDIFARYAVTYAEVIKRIKSYEELNQLQVGMNSASGDVAAFGSTLPLRAQSQNVLQELSVKVSIVQEFLISRDPRVDAKTRQTFAERYARAFSKSDEIFVGHYAEGPSGTQYNSHLKTKKMTDQKDVERELRDVLDQAARLVKEMEEVVGLGFVTHAN